MPRSSRHKSHKQSKHSSRDYSDSDEDVVVKTKEKSSKDDGSTRNHRDSASGEKRKISSQVRESKDSKDPSGHGNGDATEEYVSSKRRKEKTDAVVGGDRWNGGGDERVDSERHAEKESHKGEIMKSDVKSKENSSKGESLRVESKSKSKRHDSGTGGERKEDNSVTVVAEKDESKSKGESKRKSERESSSRKEGKESKEKDRRSDKEKNGVQESKIVDAEEKVVDVDIVKKQVAQLVDVGGEKQSKRSRENNERTSTDELRNLDVDKDLDKKTRRKKEGSSEKEKYYDEPKESDGRRLSSKGDRAKDSKHRDDKHKDGTHADKYQEDGHKEDRRKDDKYREEPADKDTKHNDDKYREDGERDVKRRDDKHRDDGDRDSRRKDEKHRDDGERESRRKEDKYHDVIEKEGRRDDKYHEDADNRDHRRKDDRNHEDGDKDNRRGDERYYEDGDRDDRRKDSSYRDDGDRDYRHKEEKYREDIEKDVRYKDSKQGDGFDREKRPRDTKYRDERTSKDRSGDKADPKRSRDDGYAADPHVRKSSTYDDSPTRDDRAGRYRDDQGRRRTNEKEDYGDVKSRGSKDQRTDFDKKSGSSARMDPVTDRVRSTSRNVDMELSSSHNRRRSSPTSSSHASRDNYRSVKQDESKYRDYNYEDRSRHSMNSTRDYTVPVGGTDKTSSSRSLDKLGQKDDSHFGELPSERRLKPDTRSSPLKLVDKSPPSSADRRQFNRPDVRRNVDGDDSTQRSGGSRDWKDYPSKDVHPADEHVQADPDTQSVSSPFARSSHFSNNHKSYQPMPSQFRTTADNPSLLGSGEDDGRGKPNMRNHRRMNEPNMGRMQGNNTWRGVPSWPSPVPNGFLPFPHAPPFHSVMQPFPNPSMFGVRPSMELNHHPAPFQISDPDRYPGPGRPMGWRNQVDDSPMHGWDTSNAVFMDESPFYGRPDWDHNRNMSGNRGWDSSADWKGLNRTASVEMLPSSEKENNNNSMRNGDEIQPPQNEQNRADQKVESGDVVPSMKSFEKNEIGDPVVGSEDSGDVAIVSRKDDVPLCNVYLSKLDISAELAEPELFDKCAGSFDMYKIMSPDIDDSKILLMEDVEAKRTSASSGLLSITLFASTDDSVFQKSMSLYKKHKETFLAGYGDKPKVSRHPIPNPNQEDQGVDDVKPENLCPTESIMQGVEDNIAETLQEKIDPPAGDIMTENSDVPVSTLVDLQMPDVEDDEPLPEEHVERPDAPLGTAEDVVTVGGASKNEGLESVDTKYGPLLNSDVSSEASEAMMPESVNLSRIHHSPESTH